MKTLHLVLVFTHIVVGSNTEEVKSHSRPFNSEANSDTEGKTAHTNTPHIPSTLSVQTRHVAAEELFTGDVANSLHSVLHVITAVISAKTIAAHYKSVKSYYQDPPVKIPRCSANES